MKLKVDHQADALYLTLSAKPASESEEVSPGIIVDFDESGRAVGIEMLHLSKRTTQSDVHRLLFESVPPGGKGKSARKRSGKGIKVPRKAEVIRETPLAQKIREAIAADEKSKRNYSYARMYDWDVKTGKLLDPRETSYYKLFEVKVDGEPVNRVEEAIDLDHKGKRVIVSIPRKGDPKDGFEPDGTVETTAEAYYAHRFLYEKESHKTVKGTVAPKFVADRDRAAEVKAKAKAKLDRERAKAEKDGARAKARKAKAEAGAKAKSKSVRKRSAKNIRVPRKPNR